MTDGEGLEAVRRPQNVLSGPIQAIYPPLDISSEIFNSDEWVFGDLSPLRLVGSKEAGQMAGSLTKVELPRH